MTRCVVVTGSSSGIGAASVKAFRKLGWETIGVDKTETSGAHEHIAMDLGDPRCGERLTESLGDAEVHGLVNAAAVHLMAPPTDVTPAEFDHLYAVNVRAPLLLAAALRDPISDSGGFVINVGSIHAVATSRNVSIYAASKGAIVSLTRALAMDWAPEIRVNAVLPGAVRTNMLLSGLSKSGADIDDLSDRHPLGRVGEPEDIADAVVFLARNRFATGTILTVDGGATAHLSTE